MDRYNFKVQFCRRDSERSPEVIFEGFFFASTKEKADQLANEISKSFQRLELIPDLEVRPYEVITTKYH